MHSYTASAMRLNSNLCEKETLIKLKCAQFFNGPFLFTLDAQIDLVGLPTDALAHKENIALILTTKLDIFFN